jgi:hypothetical protein
MLRAGNEKLPADLKSQNLAANVEANAILLDGVN